MGLLERRAQKIKCWGAVEDGMVEGGTELNLN
jgi:hypothetical protein